MRYSIVQGPRQSFYNAYSGACRIFCLSYFLDRRPPVYEDGSQLRDFVNIEDVVGANLLVMEDERADYQVFNVGGGKSYTVLQFAEIVREVFGKDMAPNITGQYRFGDTRHIASDIGKLQSLGWQPRHSPLKSVTDYLHWLEIQDNKDEILEYAADKMKQLGVVRNVQK